MPYSTEHGCFYGLEARRVRTTTRKAFITWLDGILNDPVGPYYEPLGLTPDRLVEVTDNGDQAEALYGDSELNTYVVAVMQGDLSSRQWNPVISGQQLEGRRQEITLDLDMGIAEIAELDVAVQQDADDMIADFVANAIEFRRWELDALGLCSVSITPDVIAQQAGTKRNPQNVTFFTRVLGVDEIP